MCYGSGCDYEEPFGPDAGECRKPVNLECPRDIEEEEELDG